MQRNFREEAYQKRLMGPDFFDGIKPVGTAPNLELYYVHKPIYNPVRGRTWRYGNFISTYMQQGWDGTRRIVKRGEKFGDYWDCVHAVEEWQRMGFSGYPSSPVAFFRRLLEQYRKEKKLRYSVNFSQNQRLQAGLFVVGQLGLHGAAGGLCEALAYTNLSGNTIL